MTRRRTREEIHSRVPALMFAALLCFTRGLGYTFASKVKNDLPAGLGKLGAFVPIWMFGALWLAAGFVVVWLLACRKRSYVAITFTALPALIWALAYGIGWFSVRNITWLGALLYLSVSGLIFWAAMQRPKGGWDG